MGDGVVVAKQKRMRVTSLFDELCVLLFGKFYKKQKLFFSVGLIGGSNGLGSISWMAWYSA